MAENLSASNTDVTDIVGNESQNKETQPSKRDPMLWIQEQIENDVDPRSIIKEFLPRLILPENVDELSIWRILFQIISEPEPRSKLPHINSIDQVKNLVKECSNIIVLTGAGVSVSCGIPDFRSRDGIYARLSKDFPDLPDPQAMFDIQYFRSNQAPFFKFAKEIYPGQFTPSLCHRFIAQLDKSGRLLRNYTQNIDTLEQVAGIENVVQCHGSFATATCMNCKHKVDSSHIKNDIFAEKIPYCKQCQATEPETLNVLKPDIVFFGESLGEAFHKQIEADKFKADLLIVIGSSLKVRPVSLIPSLIKADVPQILINREPLHHLQFDVEFYGNCDDIICELCEQMGPEWDDVVGSFTRRPLENEKVQTLGISSLESERKNDIRSSLCNEDKVESFAAVSSTTVSENNADCKESERSLPQKHACAGAVSCSSSDEIVAQNTPCSENASLKRKLLDDNEEAEKRRKDLYYVAVPPNRYVFHGAELDLTSDSDDEIFNDDAADADMDAVPQIETPNFSNRFDESLPAMENGLNENGGSNISTEDVKENDSVTSNTVK